MEVGEAVVKLKGDASELNAAFASATNAASQFKNFLLGFASITTIVSIFKGIITTGAEFEKSMKNVQAVLGATNEEMKKLEDLAREMGLKTVFSAKEAGDAMYYLASAGYSAEEVANALNGTLMLATATQSDLAFTTETVVNVLNQFQLNASEADRVANVFAATISGSQATMDRLATSMSYVGTIAHTIGLSLEETSAILGTLYNAGLKASTAGTALRQAISSLLTPTSAAKEELEKLGVAVFDSEGKMRPFMEIMKDLGKAGMTTEQAMKIFGDRAAQVAIILSRDAEKVEEFTKSITGTQKAVEQAQVQMEGFNGAWKKFKNTIEEATLTIWEGLKPALTWLLNMLSEGIMKIMEFGSWLGDKLGQIIYETIPRFIEGAKAKFNEFVEIIKEIPQKVVDTISSFFNSIKKVGQDIIGQIATGIAEKYEGFKKVVTELWNIIKSVANSFKDAVLNIGRAIVEGIWNGIKGATEWLKGMISSWVGNVIDFIKKLFGISSPSTIMFGVGVNLVEGVIQGVRQTSNELHRTLNELIPKQLGTGSMTIESDLITKERTFSNINLSINIEKFMSDTKPDELLNMIVEELKRQNLIYNI